MNKPSMDTGEARAPVDIPKALRLAGGYSELLEELVDILLETYPAHMDEMRAALQERSAERLEGAAHSLKSSVGSLAADRAMDLAFDLEKAGKESRMDDAAARFSDLEEEMERVRSFLSDPGWKEEANNL